MITISNRLRNRLCNFNLVKNNYTSMHMGVDTGGFTETPMIFKLFFLFKDKNRLKTYPYSIRTFVKNLC